MTTEEMIEVVIEDGVKAYRNNYRNTLTGRRLSRHEPVILEDIEFNYWREYAVYKTGKYLQEMCPTVLIDIGLDGNNSVLQVEFNTDEEEKIVTKNLQQFIEYINNL